MGDLTGYLRVECSKCGRASSYSVKRLIAPYGADAKMTDWHLEGDCPKRRSLDMSDQCGAQCPDLVKVFC